MSLQGLIARSRFSKIPRVWLVASGGWMGRGLQIAAQLAAVRIITDNLGISGYSAFAVLVSLNGWLVLSDLSIATGLQNFVSEARVSGADIEDTIVTGTVLSFFATTGSIVMLLISGPALSAGLLGFAGLTPDEALFSFWAVCLCLGASTFGSIAYRIWFAEHRGYLANLLPALATTAGTALLWLTTRQHMPYPLTMAIIGYYLPVAVVPLVALGLRIARVRGSGRFNRQLIRPILRRGFHFWVFGILAACVLQIDYIIISQVLGERDVALYSIVARLFALVLFVYAALLAALWPVCAEMTSRQEWDKLLRLVIRYMTIGAGIVVVSGTVFFVARTHIVDLLGPKLNVSITYTLLALMVGYTLIRVWTDTFAMILQSMNDLKILWIVVPLQAVSSAAFQYLGATYFGINGLVAGLILCFLATTVWALPYRFYWHVKRSATLQTNG